MRKLVVVGAGYVGLTTAACFAELGHAVVCVDNDRRKIELLSKGTSPIQEDGLEALVQKHLRSGHLTFSNVLLDAVHSAEFVVVCVPTPQADDGSADLSYVWSVIDEVSSALKPGTVVVNKSTVPVGTAREMCRRLNRGDVKVVSNPEFLRQGSAVIDFLKPTRVVIGGEGDAVEQIASLYTSIDAPILKMSSESSETLKYAANSFLATKLTFINAIADICEVVGADVFEVANGIGIDPRIGADMLRAGPGWGGSCFPKDTRALVSIAAAAGYDFALLRGVIETNDKHYERIVDKVVDVCGGSVNGLTVAAWGLTFKAGTDDLRDSPAIKILKLLNGAGATIRAFDPTATRPYEGYPWINIASDAVEACTGADVLAVLTEWNDFLDVDPHKVIKVMRSSRIVDGRNHLDRDRWREAGFEYRGVGR